MKAPQEFVGRTLQELALRNTLNVQLVAIHRASGQINIVPRAQDRIQAGDLLVLLGENRDLDRVREIVRRPPKA
jgi:trk system potassium uptake protein TrkA